MSTQLSSSGRTYLFMLMAVFAASSVGCMMPAYKMPRGFSSTYFRNLRHHREVAPEIALAAARDKGLIETGNADPIAAVGGNLVPLVGYSNMRTGRSSQSALSPLTAPPLPPPYASTIKASPYASAAKVTPRSLW